MFKVDEYIEQLIDALKAAFGEKLVYIGLQGSYLRQEETENSDIDIMAVIGDLPPLHTRRQGAQCFNVAYNLQISIFHFAASALFKQRRFCCDKTGIA